VNFPSPLVGKGVEEENLLQQGCRLVNMKAGFVIAWVSNNLEDAVLSTAIQ
jgi:hypothetical protein